MADVNLYFYIEDLDLTAGQRQTLVDQLKQLGRRDGDGNPKNRNHWRARPDGRAMIFEAWWDDAQLTAAALRGRLAAIFGVANTAITYSSAGTAYGPAVTYSYGGVPRLRVGVFGGVGASYAESQAAALAFLADNSAAWGG